MYRWNQTSQIGQHSYECGFCGNKVAPDQGYFSDSKRGEQGYIFICPFCTKPTFISHEGYIYPSTRMGNNVLNITEESIEKLYNEARDCTAANAHTASVLLCRKILMHIAVENGADEGLSFIKYINFLESNGYTPPNSRKWVDKIRQKGNETNHEIIVMTEGESKQILKFVEMLLKFIYEFADIDEEDEVDA